LARTSEHPPTAPEAEELAELSDDVIIAQESRAHAPQPRVRVNVDPRTVVIADDAEQQAAGQRATPTEPVRQLPPFTHATEPTVVIRDRRTIGSSRPPPRYSSAPPRDPRVMILVMCLIAALLAFSLGAALALLLARRGEPPARAAEPGPRESER
jgi:hypothetical protein